MNRDKVMTFLKKSLRFLPDKSYIKLYYRLRVGRKLNMGNPTTLNEKLQWMKFNYRFPLQTIVSDKYLVRDYVENKIGIEYLIPLYGNWLNFDDIDFDALPDQFVLKCNHDSGGLAICKDKKTFDQENAKKKINKSLKDNFFYIGREYQYKNIIPRIICEKFISDNGNVPMDYKIYCFNGKPDVILVCKNRFRNDSHRAQYLYFDQNWNFVPLNKGDELSENPNIEKPKNLDKMLSIARKLSEDFIFARIDLYNIDGKIYFGEITLTPNSGFDPDITEETDLYFGNKLEISLLKNAKGKYITFLDGDDYYSDCCKLQKQVDALEKHPECVGCGHPINMKWEENPTRPAQSVGTVASKAVIIPRKIYWRYLWLHADTLLFRNVIRDKVESIDHNFFDDNIIACYFLKFGDFIYLPESMAVYRQIGESSWNRRSELQKAYVNMHVYKSSLEILDGMKRDSFIKCYVAWKEFYKNRKKTIKLDKDMGGLEEIRFVEKTLQYKDSNFIFKLKYELMYGPIMHSGFIIKCFRKLRVFAYKKV